MNKYDLYATAVILFPWASIGIGLYIAAHRDKQRQEEEHRRRAEELKYEYDPKNWDTLNR
jgi:preprotein translocase subunit YajC